MEKCMAENIEVSAAVTYEYEKKAPQTYRYSFFSEDLESAAKTAAFRASKEKYPANPTSMVVLVELVSARDAEISRQRALTNA